MGEWLRLYRRSVTPNMKTKDCQNRNHIAAGNTATLELLLIIIIGSCADLISCLGFYLHSCEGILISYLQVSKW